MALLRVLTPGTRLLEALSQDVLSLALWQGKEALESSAPEVKCFHLEMTCTLPLTSHWKGQARCYLISLHPKPRSSKHQGNSAEPDFEGGGTDFEGTRGAVLRGLEGERSGVSE